MKAERANPFSVLSEYELQHLPSHLSGSSLFVLAADELFLEAQAGAFPGSPDLPLQTLRMALLRSTELDRAGPMAKLCLAHAEWMAKTDLGSPLDALRDGDLRGAWRLADLADSGRRALWHFLLTWELGEGSRLAEANATLARMRSQPVARLSGWLGECAAFLLVCVTESSKDDFWDIQGNLLDQNSRRKLSENLLLMRDIEGALRLLDQIRDRDIRDEGLAVIIVTLAHNGEFDKALKLLRRMKVRFSRVCLLAQIAREQLERCDRQVALGTLKQASRISAKIKDRSSRICALSSIAEVKACAGEKEAAHLAFTDALQAASGLRDEDEKTRTLCRIAEAMAGAGEKELSIQTFALAIEPILAIEHEDEHMFDRSILEIDSGHVSEFVCALEAAMKAKPKQDKEELLLISARARVMRVMHGDFSAALQAASEILDNGYRDRAFQTIAEAQLEAERFGQALGSAQEIRDLSSRSAVLVLIGIGQALAGDESAGRTTLAKSLSQQSSSGEDESQYRRVWTLTAIAEAQGRAGRLDEARTTLEVAEEICRSTQDVPLMYSPLEDVVRARLRIGDVNAALQVANEANSEERDRVMMCAAEEAAKLGHLTKSFDIARRIRCPWSRAIALTTVGSMQARLGEGEEGNLTLRCAAKVALEIEDTDSMSRRSEALRGVAQGLADIGNFNAALQIAKSIEDEKSRAKAINSIAVGQKKAGLVDEAQKTFLVATREARAIKEVFSREEALAAVATSRADVTEFREAFQTMRMLNRQSSCRPQVLAAIATAQARAGYFEMSCSSMKKIKSDKDRVRIRCVIAEEKSKAGMLDSVSETLTTIALNEAQKIEYAKDRAEALAVIAETEARIGLGEDAVRTAELIIDNRARHLSGIARAFSTAGNKQGFKRLLISCACYPYSAYWICALLAQLYPEQASKVSRAVIAAIE